MGKLKKNESGFSVVEVVLVLVVIALIGTVGWLVYRNTTTAYTKSITKKIPTTSPTKTSNIKYLTITQWGIKAPYTSSDTLSYVINSNNPTLATIISKYMKDTYGCTGTNNLPSGAGSISEYNANDTAQVMSTTPETYAQLALQEPADYKQIGTYVYGFNHDQAACSNQALSGSPGGMSSVNADILPAPDGKLLVPVHP